MAALLRPSRPSASGSVKLFLGLLALAVYSGSVGCRERSPQAKTSRRVGVRLELLPDGRFCVCTGTILGTSAKGLPPRNPFLGDGGRRWPKVRKFETERVEIVDDEGRRYNPGESWHFCDIKGGGRYLSFEIVPRKEATELRIDVVFVANNTRFEIKEDFVKVPEGEWENRKTGSRYKAPKRRKTKPH